MPLNKFVSCIVLAGGISVSSLAVYALVRDKTIEDKLTREGYSFLDTSENGKDEQSWNKLVSSYGGITNKIPDLESILDNNSKTLKDKCKSIKETKISEDKDEKKIKAAKECCTRESPYLKEPTKNQEASSVPKGK